LSARLVYWWQLISRVSGEKGGRVAGGVVKPPSITERTIHSFEVSPTPNKTPADIGSRHIVSALTDTGSDALEGDFGCVEPQIYNFDSIAARSPFPDSLHIGASVEGAFKGREREPNDFGLVVAAVVTPLALSLSKPPSDDVCQENGKGWILEHGWIWQRPRDLPRGSLLLGARRSGGIKYVALRATVSRCTTGCFRTFCGS
jgi:hypothetical protein